MTSVERSNDQMMDKSADCRETTAGSLNAHGDAAVVAAAASERPPPSPSRDEASRLRTSEILPNQQPSAGDADGNADALVRPPTSPAPHEDNKQEEPNRPPQTPMQNVGGGPVVYVRESHPVNAPPGYMAGGPMGQGGGGWGGGGYGGGGGGGWGGGGYGGGGWGGHPGYGDDDVDAWPAWFAAASVRRAFVRKVYSILALQLALTVGVISLFVFEPSVKHFALQNMEVYIVAMVVFLTTYITLVCCGNVRRRYPCNVVLLAIFTLSFAYLLGTMSAFHSTYIVFLAVGITAAVCLLVTLIATFTEVDITGCNALLCVISMGVMIFGFTVMMVSIFWGYNHILMAVYAGLIAIVFSLYLMYDTQMLMGGRQVALSPDEHIFAALNLYVDIAYMFWAILLLLGVCCSK